MLLFRFRFFFNLIVSLEPGVHVIYGLFGFKLNHSLKLPKYYAPLNVDMIEM